MGNVRPACLTPSCGQGTTVIAFTAAVAAALAITGGPHWSTPTAVSSGDHALNPEFTMNLNGDALAVWDQEIGADCPSSPASLSCIHIVTAAARPRTTSVWSAPVDVDRPGVGSTPRIAVNANGASAIAWIHDIGADRVTQATYRRDPLGLWPEPNDLSDYAARVTNLRVAVDPTGDAVVAWQESGATGWAIEAELRSAATGVWGAPVVLDTSGSHFFSGPALAVGQSGEAIVAWIDYLGAVRVATGQPVAGTWSPPVTLSLAGGYTVTGPAAAIGASGDAAVAWKGASSKLQSAFRSRGGQWRTADVGALAALADPEPDVAVDGDSNVVAVWLDSGVLRSAVRSAAQGMWSPQRKLAPSASDPHIAVTRGGNAVAAWTGDGNVLSAIRPAAGDWQKPVVLASNASGARIGVDDASRGIAVWNRADGNRIVVESADLTGTAPVLDLVRIPSSSQARRRVVFSVRASAWVSPLSGLPVWRFGDGSRARGTRVTHAYAHRGCYLVTVTQVAGPDQASATGTIIVRPRASRGH
jgi:PKD domain